MANKEHLAILNKGVRAWNNWRERNLGIRPDLSNASLSTPIAQERWPHRIKGWRPLVDRAHINFGNADLTGANLECVALTYANLMGADLSNAFLSETNFHGAELGSANLSFASLSGAVFEQSRLRETKFNSSGMIYTYFGAVDLSEAVGLDTVNHLGPSTIGINTIFASKGKIPEVFLRGAGVPEPFIREMKALVNAMEPSQFYSCFISYSSKDQKFAERLYADLQQKNVRCWIAPRDMKIGDKFRQRIDEAIRDHDKLLLVLTESSVKSAWVEKEAETAFEKERKQKRKVLCPIRLDDVVMKTKHAWAADIRRTRHIGDFREWKDHDKYKKSFEKLMGDLSAGEGSK